MQMGGGRMEIGYCFIGDGANFRYTFADRGDALVGPYYVSPDKRGMGLAAKLVSTCLRIDPPKTGKAWGFISDDNVSSKKTYEKVGSRYICDFCFKGKLRCLYKCPDGVKGDMGLWYHNTKEVLHG